MTTYEELLKTTNNKFENEIGPLLEKHDLLVRYTGVVDGNFLKILDRLELQKESISEKILALSQHMDKTKTIVGFDEALLRDLIFLMAQSTLGYFEILTKWIIYCIDLDKIRYGDRKIMYGSINN